jgi:hypothetical protein
VIPKDGKKSGGLLFLFQKEEPLLPGREVWQVKTIEGHLITLENGNRVGRDNQWKKIQGEQVFHGLWERDQLVLFKTGDKVVFLQEAKGGSGPDDSRSINEIYLKARSGHDGSTSDLVKIAKQSPLALNYLAKIAGDYGRNDAVDGLVEIHRENPAAAIVLADLVRKNNPHAWHALGKVEVEGFVRKMRQEWRLFLESLPQSTSPLTPPSLEDTDRFSLIEEMDGSSISGVESLKLAAQAGNPKAYAALAEEGLKNFHSLAALTALAEGEDLCALNHLAWAAERNGEALEALLHLANKFPTAKEMIQNLNLQPLMNASKTDTPRLALLIRLIPHRSDLRNLLSQVAAGRLAEAAQKDLEVIPILYTAFKDGNRRAGKALKKMALPSFSSGIRSDPKALLLLVRLKEAGNAKAIELLRALAPHELLMTSNEEDSPSRDEFYDVSSRDSLGLGGVFIPLRDKESPSLGQIWTVKSIEGDRVILHEGQKILKRGSFSPIEGEREFRVYKGKSGTIQLKEGDLIHYMGVSGGSGKGDDDKPTKPFQQISTEEKERILALYQNHPSLKSTLDESGWTLEEKRDLIEMILKRASQIELTLANFPTALRTLQKAVWTPDMQYAFLIILVEKAMSQVHRAYQFVPQVVEALMKKNWDREDQYRLLTVLADRSMHADEAYELTHAPRPRDHGMGFSKRYFSHLAERATAVLSRRSSFHLYD